MQHLFASGQVIDLALAVLVLEAAFVWWAVRRPDALPLPTVLAGAGLLVAWRVAHAQADWFWVALPLSAAGLAHGWDVWRRWPQR